MKKLVFFGLAAIIFLAGCVSTKTFKAAVEESEARKTQLEKAVKEAETLKKAVEDSRQENDGLKKEISDLRGKLDEFSTRGIMTSKEIDDLRQEREKLASSDKAKADEISDLKSRLESLAKEKDSLLGEKEYLNREVERLKVKAGEISAEKEKELANVKGAYENLVKEMKQEIEKGEIKITQAVDRLSVNLVEKILFDSGRAEIKPEGLKVLKRVGDILKKVADKQIRVEGHTDNVQISERLRKKFPTNWELSTARADTVVRYLQDKVGIGPNMLSAAGFSEYKPVASNETAEGRAQNRRIEIVLLPLDVDRVLQELKK